MLTSTSPRMVGYRRSEVKKALAGDVTCRVCMNFAASGIVDTAHRSRMAASAACFSLPVQCCEKVRGVCESQACMHMCVSSHSSRFGGNEHHSSM